MNPAENENSKTISGALAAVGRPQFNAAAIQASMISLVFGALYLPVFMALVRMWWGSDDYSHGFVVPLISLYMVWTKRERLSNLELSPDLVLGIPVALLASILLIAGKLGVVIRVQEVSLIIMVAGLTLLLLGRSHLRALALPIAYLFFMIKIFGDGSERFHWPFQLLAANIGVWLLHAFGFTAFHEAQFIQLPNVTLEVASACSGVRFLVSIIAIGIPLAHFTQRTWPRKIGLVAFGVATAILANGFRVALIGAWTYYGGSAVHGPLHVFQGVFVAWFGFAALFAGAWFLSSGRRKNAPIDEDKKEAPGPRQFARDIISQASVSRRWKAAWIVSLIIIAATASYYHLHRINPVPMQESLKDLPIEIGEWRGTDINPLAEALRVEATDNEILRLYRKADGGPATLYIGYFEKQEYGKDLVTYLTSWKFHRGESAVRIRTGQGSGYIVNRAVLMDGAGRRIVYFWYDINGRVVAGRYEAKLWSMWDGLKKNSANGAMIAVSAPFYGETELKNASDRAEALAREVIVKLYGGRKI